MKRYDQLDELTALPKSQRPTFLPLSWSREYFQGWALLTLAVPLTLLVGNCIWAIVVRQTASPLIASVIAAGFLIAAHGSAVDGISSSNTTTLCKSTEPIRFWMSVACLYLSAAVIGFISWVI